MAEGGRGDRGRVLTFSYEAKREWLWSSITQKVMPFRRSLVSLFPILSPPKILICLSTQPIT